MLRSTILALALVLSLPLSPARAQLGPKDGANLAPTDLERVKVGDKAPDFTLEDIDGSNISLSNFRGKKSVVLVFYRGHW
jgi:cytochrome oxidase Cu insertion factor (SCO1/SenC/PrrC family)